MSRSRFTPLLTSILPHLPGFACKGRLLFMSPIDTILRGVSFEPSAFDRVSFQINTFVLPLCVPTDHISFLFGEPLFEPGRGYGWTSDEPDLRPKLVKALQQYALPFLTLRGSPIEFIAATPIRTEWYTLQAIGYCHARCGRVREAIEILDVLLARGTETRAWEIALVAEVRDFRSKLVADPSAALEQLIAWETETIENLGLTEYRRAGIAPVRA